MSYYHILLLITSLPCPIQRANPTLANISTSKFFFNFYQKIFSFPNIINMDLRLEERFIMESNFLFNHSLPLVSGLHLKIWTNFLLKIVPKY